MNTIYISRRCKVCHGLLIILHQHKDKINFKVVDIDSNSYPNIIQYVPTLYLSTGIVVGDELFKYINSLLSSTPDTRVTPPLEESSIPKQSNTEKLEKKEEEDGVLNGFCMDGMCGLSYSSLEDDESNGFENHFEMIDQSTNTKIVESDFDEKDQHGISKKYEEMMEQRSKLNLNN